MKSAHRRFSFWPRLAATALALALTGCGGAAAGGSVAPAGPPRPGGLVDLRRLAPSAALVVLHADMNAVRQDPARYDWFADELSNELGLSSESSTVRALLDRTSTVLGSFLPGTGEQNEGMLFFSGQYADSDFERALEIARSRHGSEAAPTQGADGRQVYAMGSATIARIDQWTWAIGVGNAAREHIASVSLSGASGFRQNLLEFGPRIGLPRGAAQAWANQDQPVGVDMVALVFAGESPQMVHNFVSTVTRHLGISGG